ncbi:MAG: cobalamin B12-binding domain-containing protein [Kosmotoga sp.]|nr:MAG: cobalamin B12-binding domain-containing protein [Kosmotoga sp.]
MTIYENFIKLLDAYNKEKAFTYALEQLNNGSLSVVELYEQILKPSLNNWNCNHEINKLCIWQEHIRSSIIRSIIEGCYPYILKEKEKTKSLEYTVAVVCPPDEQHELGARLVTDYFTINGFKTTFVGSNTPVESFIEAIRKYKFDYIAISVTNYYHLFKTKKLIQYIRSVSSETKIVVGGRAFQERKNFYKELGADYLIENIDDISKLKGNVAI